MEDSGKHGFHGLEHDSKMRLLTTYSHTSTPRGYEAPGKTLQQKTQKRRTEDGKKVQNTPANGGIDRRKSYHFRRLARETEPEKRENGSYAKKYNQEQTKSQGSKAEESKNSRAKPKRLQKCTWTRYVRNPTRARGMDIVPHPAGATSKPNGELPGKSNKEN